MNFDYEESKCHSARVFYSHLSWLRFQGKKKGQILISTGAKSGRFAVSPKPSQAFVVDKKTYFRIMFWVKWFETQIQQQQRSTKNGDDHSETVLRSRRLPNM